MSSFLGLQICGALRYLGQQFGWSKATLGRSKVDIRREKVEIGIGNDGGCPLT